MNLILLTIGFPNKNRDVFVNNEIGVLSKKFDKIYIFPVIENKLLPKNNHITKSSFDLPDNVEVIDIKYSIPDLLLFDFDIFKEFIKEFRFDIRFLYGQVRAVLYSNITLRNIESFINRNSIERENTVLYSFWFHYNALAISRLKGAFYKKICRAHRYDLYEEWTCQPFKSYSLERLDNVYPCSKMGERYIVSMYGAKDKTRVMYLGTYNRHMVNDDYSDPDIFTIVSCSSVVEVKRVWKIIDALSIIEEGTNITWIHIGDGIKYEEVRGYANSKLAGKENIRYIFLGRLNNQDIMEYYHNNYINVFINVSESEGLPVSIMEACSYGMPIIATDVGGTSEIVRDRSNGFLLDKDFSDKELADLIKMIYGMSKEEYRKLRDNSRRIWEENFNAEKTYSMFAEEMLKDRCL